MRDVLSAKGNTCPTVEYVLLAKVETSPTVQWLEGRGVMRDKQVKLEDVEASLE
jgi:hypothetical protein